MKKLVGSALAAGAMVAMTSVAAQAASQPPQNFGNLNSSGAVTSHLNISGGFSDIYNFTTSGMTKLSIAASETAVLLNSATITNFVATLYRNVGGVFTQVAQGTKYALAMNGDTSAFTYNTMTPGAFRLIVSGTANSKGAFSANYSGAITVAPVPLPNSVALLGVAVLGLGVAGAVRRKSAKAAPAAI